MGIPVFFASHNPSRSLPSPRPVVRARKPNSLALPAGGREPNQNMGCFSASFPFQGSRSETEFIGFAGRRARAESERGTGVGVARRRRKGLQGTRRQHGRPRAGKKAPGLAWPDEGARACREQGANIEGRALEKRRRGWRSPTVEQGLAGCKAPTWKDARRFSRRIVGAVQRRSKGLGGARRQQGRSRAGKKAPGLAWPDEGTRACGMQGANMEGRAPGKRRLCWRGPTKEQGLAGYKAPTGKDARRFSRRIVGVAQRKSKGLGGARRQHGRPRGRNRNRKRAAAAALFVLLTSVVLFRQKCSFQ